MFAAIYLPNFELQAALRHEPALHERPVALIDDQVAKATIIQLNEAAEDAGVRCGMAPSQGLARCLSLIIKVRDRHQERILSNTILQFAFSLAPDVEATASGVWTVRFTDTRQLEQKVTRVVTALGEMHIAARGGIAPTPDASLLAAHAANAVLRVDDAKSFLASLPLEALAIG